MIRYEGHFSYKDRFRADMTARMIFGAVKLRISYDQKPEGGLYLLGFCIRTIEQIADYQDRKTSEYSLNAKGNKLSDPPEAKQEAGTADASYDNIKEACTTGTSHDRAKEKGTAGEAEEEVKGTEASGAETMQKLWKSGKRRLLQAKETISTLLDMSDDVLKHTIVDVVKGIMRQLLPRSISGDFRFGLDDPYYTGKLLQIFALLYAKMGDKLRVEPVWNELCFAGEIQFEGKIYLTVICWYLLKLTFNGQFRKIWREYNGK